jgi:carboxyl-terminal processing protease
MRRSIQGLLCVVLAAGIAGISPLLQPRAALAEAAPVITATSEQLKTDAVTALRRGEFDRTSELLKQAAKSSSDPTLEMMASWVSNFSSQYDKTLAGRKAEYNKVVAQVALLQEREKPDYALDAATRAYTLAIDKRAFRTEPWLVQLVTDRTAAAEAYEKAGQWHLARNIYVDLGVIQPSASVWKDKEKAASRYVRIQAMYAPEYFKTLIKTRQKDDKQIEKWLEEAKLVVDTTTRPAAEANEDEELVDAKIDWHDITKGIDYEAAPAAIKDAVKNWYREASYAKLTKGGLEGLRVLANTPGVETAFPSLADQAKKQKFVAAVDTELANLNKVQPDAFDFGDFKETLSRIRAANTASVDLPESVLVYEYMDASLNELDRFSNMIWPQQYEEFRSSTEGEFSGVGIQIERDNKTGNLKVVSPIEDSPAYKAGIKAGSSISHINGEPVKKLMLDQAVKKIKGPTGSRVTLTIVAPDGTSKDYSLRRDTVKVASIKGWKRQPGGSWDWMVDPVQRVGYIRLTSFTKTSADEMERALKEMERQGAKGVILDLRSDPGGLLPAAVDVADRFIPSGTIVSTRADRETPQSPSVSSADPDGQKIRIPLIVLVNQFSASASEIVSGALKDHHRAIIVGERTYGKGSVQMLFRITGNTVLKLTTAHYYLPSGRCLHREETSTEWGVDPDYTIELTSEQVRDIVNARQEMDVLYGPGEKPQVMPSTQPGTVAGSTKPAKPTNLLEVDPQLSAAVMLMRLQVAGVKL